MIMNNNIRYAPIIIPTCNRVEHLKQCISSLENNILSNETELYISIDYPPKEDYINGYQNVCKYLSDFKENNRFSKIHVFIQTQNLGVYRNSLFLREQIKKDGHATFIETEDDNVFSKNTLLFFNEALKRFENDGDITYVCAFQKDKKPPITTSAVRQSFCRMWGYATWVEKSDKAIKWMNSDTVLNAVKNPKIMMKILWFQEGVFKIMVNGFLINHVDSLYLDRENVGFPDVLACLYMYANDKFAVFPALNMVQNEGNDGSGMNTKKGDKTYEIEDVRTNFDLKDVPIRKIYHADAQRGLRGRIGICRTVLEYFYWLCFVRKLA